MKLSTDELTLILIYLTSWEEQTGQIGGKQIRTWRGYSFNLLNKMERNGLLKQEANSVILTAKGKQEAEKLKLKYENAKPGNQKA